MNAISSEVFVDPELQANLARFIFLDRQSRTLYADWESEDFRLRCASHDVRQYRSGIQPFPHPRVGDLTLSYEALQLTADISLTLVVYTAEPDSTITAGAQPTRKRSTARGKTSR